MSLTNFFALFFYASIVFSQTNSVSQNHFKTLPSSEIMQLYSEMSGIQFDNLRIAFVESLVVQRDRGKLIFKNGTFYLAKPVQGKVISAVFLGDGVFELKPPTRIERQQVLKYVGKDSLNENFSAAYFLFTDKTARELEFHLRCRRSGHGWLFPSIEKTTGSRGRRWNIGKLPTSDRQPPSHRS